MNLRQMAENKVSIAFEDDNDRKEFMDWYWKNGGCNENGRDVYLPIECKGVNLRIYDDNGYMPEDYNKIFYNWDSMAITTWKSLRPKSKSYELIITNTNKVIILDKENGRKGISKCHPDDEYSVYKGFEIAWNRLNEIGTVMNLDTINLSPMKSPENSPNYIVHKNGNPLNNEANNLESIVLKKPLLSEEIEEEVAVDLPKLYDSFGNELKEGDIVYNMSGTFADKQVINIRGGELYNEGLSLSHNSSKNNGVCSNDVWKVLKIS